MQDSIVRTPRALRTLCRELGDSDWIALDTEFVRTRTYYARLCLIQVAAPGVLACVDPLASADLAPLFDILYRPAITKVMHAARQDLELFYGLRGTVPAPVFDTQVAAALTGCGAQLGYATLVRRILGVELPKAHTRTDWCRRPLSAAQIAYAEDDVRYLGPLYERLAARAEALGRIQWVAEECTRLVDPAAYGNASDQAYLRLRAGRRLPPAKQRLLQSLAQWREDIARRHDLPRGWVVPDAALVALAEAVPQTPAALTRVEGLGPARARRWGRDLLRVIREAGRSSGPVPAWPEPPQLGPEQQALLERLLALVRRRAQQHKLAPELVATRAELSRLVAGAEDLPVLRSWRRRLVGEELLELVRAGGAKNC